MSYSLISHENLSTVKRILQTGNRVNVVSVVTWLYSIITPCNTKRDIRRGARSHMQPLLAVDTKSDTPEREEVGPGIS